MKDKALLNKEKIFYIICFSLCTLMLIYNTYNIMFAVHDDMRIYTLVRNGELFENAFYSANTTGRITHLWNHLLLGLPFVSDKVWFYKLFSYGSLLFDIGALYLLLSRHFDKRFAALSSLLVISFSSISHWHSLFISYSFCHQIPLGFFILSVHFFLNYKKEYRKKDMILCCVCCLFSCMIYEAFTFAVAMYICISMYLNKEKTGCKRDYFKKTFKDTIAPFTVVLIYIIVYFVWKQTRDISFAYDGTAIDISNPVLSLKVVFKYSLGAFPYIIFINHYSGGFEGLINTLMNVRIPQMITSFLSAVVAVMLLKKINLDKKRILLFIIALQGTLLPVVIIGFTSKYIDWSTEYNIWGYLPSFYSYFFLITFICLIFVFIYNFFNNKIVKKLICLCVFFVVFGLSLIAYINNYNLKPHYISQYMRCRVLNAVATDELPLLTEESDLYVPESIGIHSSNEYTDDFLNTETYVPVHSVISGQIPDFINSTYCLRFNENNDTGLFGCIDERYTADSLKVITAYPDIINTVVISATDGTELKFENVRHGDVLQSPDNVKFDMSQNPMRP